MAVTFVLDTSAYSGFERGDAHLRTWMKAANDIIVPLIVIGELRAGFASGSKQQANEQSLQRFLDAPNVTTVSLSDVTTKQFALIFAQLRLAGTPIGSNDIWIAATAIELNSPLLTLDSDFSRVDDLELLAIS